MEANIYYPFNLNLYDFKCPDFKQYKFKYDHAYYIVHLICSIPLYRKKYDAITGVPLSAKALQQITPNYKEYLQWLIENGVIKTNNYYEEGKARKYSLTKRYQQKVREDKIFNYTLKKRVIKHRKNRTKSTKGNSHLTKHFNPKLKLNKELANDYINAVYNYKIDHPNRWDVDYSTNKKKHPLNQYNSALISMANLSNVQYNLSRDNTSGRFHSPITSMQSDLRNCLTYDGQSLVNIDIANSQPYLSNSILNPNDEVTKYVSNSNLSKEIKESYFRLLNSDFSYSLPNFNLYQDLTSKGVLYDYMGKELDLNNDSRKEVKSTMFQVMFTDNKYYHQIEAKNKRKFNELFPSVYKVFSEVKRTDKSHLAILLQFIESHIIIDIVTKKIALDNSKIPLFTIHDSIATTEQYVPYVKDVFNDELTRIIGVEPTLSQEYWNVNNLKFPN